MTLRCALILLRLSEFNATHLFEKYPEFKIGKKYHKKLDKEITDEQFFDLFLLCKNNNMDERPSYNSGHTFILRLKPLKRREPSSFGYLNHKEEEPVLSKDVVISETNEERKIIIRIGMILQCNEKDHFGILLAQRNNQYGRDRVEDNRVFYFDKENDTFMPRYSLVAYVEDIINPNKAYNIIDLNEFENISGYGGSPKAMRLGVPYISEQTAYDIIGIPHIYTSEKILYYYNIFYDTWLYHDYFYLRTLKRIVQPVLSEIINKLEVFRNYVEKFDFNSVIETYTSREYGYLQKRCGRDDHFNITKIRNIQNNDPYIRSIVLLDFEDNYFLGSSSDDDYDLINKEEIERVKKEAREKYSKSEHYEFLKKEYLSSIEYVRKEIASTWLAIESKFNIHAALCYLKPIDKDNYKVVVKEYNSTICQIKEHYE